MPENVIYQLESRFGKLVVFEDRVKLEESKHSFLRAIGSSIDGSKEIFYIDMVAVQHKPFRLRNGFIQFEIAGHHNSSNYDPETSFTYTSGSLNNEAQKVVDYVQSRISFFKNNNKQAVVMAPSSSVADEIKKFKELLDTGAITQEEYDKKKKELLGM